MLTEPLVSVVIPVYNVENYIGETIQSVLSQSYNNIEIITIDDESTDRTAEIIKNLQTKYKNIKYIFQKNSGVSGARNTGIRASQGEYIAFLDGDDLWLKTKLKKQVGRIIASKYDACYCGFIEYIDGKFGKSIPRRFYEDSILIKFLQEKTIGWTSTWLIKKDLIIQNNIWFSEDCSWGEDLEFFAKIVSVAMVCNVEEYLALYRIRGNSLSTSPKRLAEIEVWNRFSNWFNSQTQLLNHNKKKINSIIKHYKIPGVVTFYLFEGIFSKGESYDKKGNDELYSYMKNFRPSGSVNSFKLYVKKIAINNKLVLSLIKKILKTGRNKEERK